MENTNLIICLSKQMIWAKGKKNLWNKLPELGSLIMFQFEAAEPLYI